MEQLTPRPRERRDGDAPASPDVEPQEQAALEEESSKPLARLALNLPLGFQVQAFARQESAQLEREKTEAEAEAERRSAGRSATRAKLLQAVADAKRASAQDAGLTPRSPLGQILGGNRLKGLLRRSRRDSTRERDSRESDPNAVAPRDSTAGPPPPRGDFRVAGTEKQGSFRSNTRELALGIVNKLGFGSRAKIATPCHVWVHREVDETPRLAPFAFGEMVVETPNPNSNSNPNPNPYPNPYPNPNPNQVVENLAKYGADAKLEGDGDLEECLICIFLLSPSFFGCERSLALMRKAVLLKKQVIIINMPGGMYRPTHPNHAADDAGLEEGSEGTPSTFTFPENAFNPAWQPYCPDVKPAFGEICITWELTYPHACMTHLIKRVSRRLERPHPHPRPNPNRNPCPSSNPNPNLDPNPNLNPNPNPNQAPDEAPLGAHQVRQGAGHRRPEQARGAGPARRGQG